MIIQNNLIEMSPKVRQKLSGTFQICLRNLGWARL